MKKDGTLRSNYISAPLTKVQEASISSLMVPDKPSQFSFPFWGRDTVVMRQFQFYPEGSLDPFQSGSGMLVVLILSS